ncbi:MAG: alpha/beta hydrolase [Microscillaceae bacterium]|jgi:pimeloyl-ACP methyl ester carboxylesterase|nr:alpha/beta hydrolase [Microscillaceae bacterium]
MNKFSLDNYFLNRQARKILKTKPNFGEGYQFLDLGDFLLRYQVVGEGEFTLVFIPDAPNTIEHYQKLNEMLKPHCRVVIFEIPGQGFSYSKTAKYKFSLVENTDLTIRFLEKLAFPNYVLAFPCASGYIAWQVATKKPELVKSVISIQTPTWAEELKWVKRLDPKGTMNRPYIGQIFLQMYKRKVAEGWYHVALPKNNYNPQFWETCEKAFEQGSAYCLASLFQGAFNVKNLDFELIKQKSVIIWGLQDRSHRKTDKTLQNAHFEDFTNQDFAEAGHFPDLEFPEKFTQIVLDLKSKLGL